MFLSQLWRRGGAELFFSKDTADQTTEHSPTPSSNQPPCCSPGLHPLDSFPPTICRMPLYSHMDQDDESSIIQNFSLDLSTPSHLPHIRQAHLRRACALHQEFKAEHKNSAFLTLLTLPNGFIPELFRNITTEKVTRWGVQGETYKRSQLGDWHTWWKTDLGCKRTSVFHPERKSWQKQSTAKTYKTLHSWTDFLTSHS